MRSESGRSTRLGRARASFAALLALGVVIVVALELRFAGIDCLLPTTTQLDSSVIVHQVERLRAGDPALDDPHAAYYPRLLATAVAATPAPRPLEAGVPHDLAAHAKAASAPWVEVRVVSAIFSLLAVPLTFLFARRWLAARWAVLAAGLVALSLLHLSFTTQERPHGTAAAMMLFAVLAALRLRERGDVASYLLAGGAAGLAVGALHYGAFVVPALVAAVWLREPGARRASAWWLAASLALVALAVYRFYPYWFAGSASFLHFQETQSGAKAFNLSGQPLLLEKFDGSGFATIVETLWSYDPLLFFGTLLGGAILSVRVVRGAALAGASERRAALVPLAFLVPYLLVTGLYAETWERFVLALLPYAAVLTAWGLARVVEGERERARLAAIVAAAVLALAFAPAAWLAERRTEPDTLERAARWVETNADASDRIVMVPYFDLPLLHGEQALAENSKRPWASNWIEYQMKLGPADFGGERRELLVVPGARLEALHALEQEPLGYFRAHGARYVVISHESETRAMARAREALAREAELVARFSPEREDQGVPTMFMQRHLEPVLVRPFFLRVIEARSMGPTLEIYRLSPAAR